MTRDQNFVIVGAGLAGAKAAEGLRGEGYDGRLLLLGAENERPYERPPLSKDYLRGEAGRDKLYVHDEGWYADHDVELRTGERVESLDASASTVTLASGEELHFDRALLAPGAEPRRLDVDGAQLDGVHLLRSAADSDAIRERLDAGGRLVVVGAGWIGCEVAASARQRGMDVAVVEPRSLPLVGVLGAELGAFYRDVHADHGVALHLDTGVEAIE